MYYKEPFILTQAIFERPNINDIVDVISMCYAARTLTKCSRLVIYGTGAERGTYWQFANVEINGIRHDNAIRAVAWFTKVTNKAIRNQGKTSKKKTFTLTRKEEEIEDLLDFFGILPLYAMYWSEIELHDENNDLVDEWEKKRRVKGWKDRTLKAEIVFMKHEIEIMESVADRMLHIPEVAAILDAESIDNPIEFLQQTIIEGQGCLSIATDDIELLRKGHPLSWQFEGMRSPAGLAAIV